MDGMDFIVMEYVPGKSLDHAIPRRGLPLSEALQYTIEIADALAAAHAAGIIHRDLKPGNIMVSDTGRVKGGQTIQVVGVSEPRKATVL